MRIGIDFLERHGGGTHRHTQLRSDLFDFPILSGATPSAGISPGPRLARHHQFACKDCTMKSLRAEPPAMKTLATVWSC